jgi:hypothetical protein
MPVRFDTHVDNIHFTFQSQSNPSAQIVWTILFKASGLHFSQELGRLSYPCILRPSMGTHIVRVRPLLILLLFAAFLVAITLSFSEMSLHTTYCDESRHYRTGELSTTLVVG